MPVAGRDHLALLGDADAAVDRPARLRPDRLVRASAAARGRTAPAVEELERQAVLAGLPGKALLRDVRQGYVSVESARDDYGVEFDPKELS